MGFDFDNAAEVRKVLSELSKRFDMQRQLRRGDFEEYGPIYECKCGMEVRWYVDPHSHRKSLLEAGTKIWHRCPADPMPEVPSMVECVCGCVVLKYRDGRKEDADTCQPHSCKPKVISIKSTEPKSPTSSKTNKSMAKVLDL